MEVTTGTGPPKLAPRRLENYFDGLMNNEGKNRSQLEVGMTSVCKLATSPTSIPSSIKSEMRCTVTWFRRASTSGGTGPGESVPHLPILRYKDSGLRKRAEWEKTWDLQRREDAGESVGTISVQ